MQTGKLAPEKIQPALQAITRAVHQQVQLIDDLMDSSQIAVGKLGLQLRPVDLGPVVASSVETVRLSAEAKGISLTVQSDGSPLPLMGDERRLGQVLWNLLNNAIKYSPNGGDITVHARNEGETLLFGIQDQGLGIPPEEQKKLFVPFSRTSVNTTAGESSTGLGLAIVKKIVESHGGRIGVESQVGKGSTFSVFIPWQKVAVR
jgi:signal transduction histidine kinase